MHERSEKGLYNMDSCALEVCSKIEMRHFQATSMLNAKFINKTFECDFLFLFCFCLHFV
jgi:hypothetical protein